MPVSAVAVTTAGSRSTASTGHPASRWRHQPALDGLRGLAVIGVVLYHAGVAWLPGGLLGVDAFFVLSGFLITGLLLDERRRSGCVDLKRFWARRARRLLPALGVLLLAVSVMVATIGTATEKATYPKDALSALGYVANWRFAFSHQGYFNDASPSPLLHLWSLGVEEQFYLLWPLAVVLLLRRRYRKTDRITRFQSGRLLRITIGGALASTLLMAILAGTGTGDDRLYYGTDTRAAPLLVGAALAVVFARRRPRPGSTGEAGSSRSWLPTAFGCTGLAVTALIWTTTSGQAAWLYRGGFTVAAIGVAAVIAGVWNRPDCVLARLLGAAPLAAVGRISYGIYLYHWPLFLLLDHKHTGLNGGSLLAMRLAATATVATVSYVYLEQPILAGGLRLPRPRLTVPATALTSVAAILLVSVIPAATVPATPNLMAGAAQLRQETARRLAQLPATPSPSPSTSTSPSASASPSTAVAEAGTRSSNLAATTRPKEPVKIFIVGDSIAFSAAWALTSERAPYKVDLLSDAIVGCGIVPLPYGDANSTSPIPLSQCTGWQGQWSDAVARFQPAVTAVFLGRWETVDRVENGQIVHIGEPGYDKQLSGLLDETVRLLSARGGKVAFIALPCYTLPELPNGSTSPADQPVRQARYNQLVREAAARHPGVASVVDLNSQICPGGQPISTYHGIPLRQDDGMHFHVLSGPALGPLLLEPLRTLAGAPARP
jgi:peptidoglycan/LPS O-acetylase OafA/YrhL